MCSSTSASIDCCAQSSILSPPPSPPFPPFFSSTIECETADVFTTKYTHSTTSYQSFIPYNFFDYQTRFLEVISSGTDSAVILRTGGGKSLLWQLPALVDGLQHNGITVVVAPTISLCRDLHRSTQRLLQEHDRECFLDDRSHSPSNRQERGESDHEVSQHPSEEGETLRRDYDFEFAKFKSTWRCRTICPLHSPAGAIPLSAPASITCCKGCRSKCVVISYSTSLITTRAQRQIASLGIS